MVTVGAADVAMDDGNPAPLDILANAARGDDQVALEQEAVATGPEPVAPEPEVGGAQAAQPVDARQAAANSIAPGCTQWVVKTWTPASERPYAVQLKAAMQHRMLHDIGRPNSSRAGVRAHRPGWMLEMPFT